MLHDLDHIPHHISDLAKAIQLLARSLNEEVWLLACIHYPFIMNSLGPIRDGYKISTMFIASSGTS